MQATRSAAWQALVIAVGIAGCSSSPPGRTFYQLNIEPILTQKCAGNTSGCHSTNTDDPFQFAAGNFDVTSFDNVQKRRDALAPFGAYSYPLLLIKAVGSATTISAATTGGLTLDYNDTTQDTFPPLQIQHSGGAILDTNSDAFFTLQNWLSNGATADGLPPPTPAQVGTGLCSDTVPSDFDQAGTLAKAPAGAYDMFKSSVQPVLTKHGCNAASCHGAPASDFYITCGMSDAELAFNFSQAWSFVTSPVDDSQILRIPLAVNAGGRGHTGGDQFASTTDPDYLALQNWAMVAGRLDFAGGDPAKLFFAQNVQPILLERGCSFEACHSPEATNDFKLRSGTQGFFSAVSLEKNYELLRDNFMAIEFPDIRRGRAISKTSLSTRGGISHRGGPVLETGGSIFDPTDTTNCVGAGSIVPANQTPLCAIQQWFNLERAKQVTAGAVSDMTTGAKLNVVYVERPTAGANTDRLSFDTYNGGADLRVVQATLDANQGLGKLDEGTSASLLGGCGLGASPDVQAPDVANDGDRVVFAARMSAADPLGIYLVKLSAPATCTRLTPAVPAQNGIMVHNFDPAFSPDGNWVVFASTRGKPGGAGPTKSRKRFLPQSDIWRVAINDTTIDASSYAQVTVLSNSEVGPQFMREGRMTMTTEKASDGFYQLSGRRINWDLTDYHPLLAQRANSLYADLTDLTKTLPSIGYASATDIREGSDGNFLIILSDLNADGTSVTPGGGALGVFNRSVGPFEADRTDPGFLASLHVLDGGDATGHTGSAAAYRGPVSLPDGQIMVAYASNAANANYDLVTISPQGGGASSLFMAAPPATMARVDAVLAYKFPARVLYDNRRQLVFGGNAMGDMAHGVLHMPDAPMLFTLLTGNLRRGRPVDAFRSSAKFLAVYSEGLCPAAGCSANTNDIYQNRVLLGTAPLADDGSVRVQLPAQAGVVLELQDANHKPVVTMGEEHQLGPGEQISMGVSQTLFNQVCAGCHGSVSGQEIDVGVSPDALTGASSSKSQNSTPATIGP